MDVVFFCDIDIYLWFVICYFLYLLFSFYIFFGLKGFRKDGVNGV